MSARVTPVTVAVLAGGPDAERDVSLKGGRAVVQALNDSGDFRATLHEIGRITIDELRAVPGEVVWPLLHGPWGEGGPMQDLLELDGRPYVGCRPAAARHAMDKLSTKLAAARTGVYVNDGAIFNPGDAEPPIALPLVVKPNFEGSTIGLHICRTREEWAAAHRATTESRRPAIIEPFVKGRELAAGVLDNGDGLAAFPLIEITPKDGFYDYEAKYLRSDTRYTPEPDIGFELTHQIQRRTLAVANALGVRHLARADFILPDEPDHRGEIEPVLLEINTMPGFTDHSLVPMAAARIGLDMPGLCASLVRCALRDHATETV
ncbi:MAG: D-alanine--D-alanine ligase family protein [Phycisphaerales bacterium]